jgi:hypothetical protein
MNMYMCSLLCLYAWDAVIFSEVLVEVLGLPDVDGFPFLHLGSLGNDIIGGDFLELGTHLVDVIFVIPAGTPAPLDFFFNILVHSVTS